jgi:oligopeptidase A
MNNITINRPAFDAFDVSTVEANLDDLLAECRQTVSDVAQETTPTWQSVIEPLDKVHNRLSLFWSPVSHLNSVKNSAELREVYKACLPKLSAYYTELGQNAELYAAIKKIRESIVFDSLDQAQQTFINKELLDFELGGVSLSDDDKIRFAELSQELSKLTTEFSDNVLDATNAWELLLPDASRLAGLPSSAIAAAAERAAKKELEGYLLNLEFPTVHAVRTFAHDRELRKTITIAFSTRASDQGPQAGEYDNSQHMVDILKYRNEKAQLLGYDSYADLSVVTKMVESPSEVMSFLNDLADRAVPKAKQELEELRAFAAESLGIEELEGWDIAYASDKMKKALFDLSDEDLKPFFPAHKAINGMFDVVGRLFGLSIQPVDGVAVYHDDVACYEIRDNQGELRGQFYLDNFARENKRGGAWMDVCATRQRLDDGVQLPIAYLTCNLTPPVGDDPALLTHMEVTTLFHEFGHGLHHMLTQMEISGVSGINGVEWDAVELPSQFLENWCWERESLALISEHFETGEALPDELLKKLRDARNFQSASQLVRQLEFSMFDMQVHASPPPNSAADIQVVLDDVRAKVAVMPFPPELRFQHSFSHIFAGGYAAGYFSYKWAEVLSADAYARFEEEGVFSESAGTDFLNEVLSVGGSRPALDSFVAFRGRKPSVDALLKQSGLAA